MKLVLLSLILAAASATLYAAENASLAGQWKLQLSISGHESEFDCTFTQSDKELGGTCKSDQGTVKVTGKLDDKTVKFQHKSTYEGQELTIAYSGKFETPAKIVGTVDVDPMGVSGDFTATQTK